MAAQTGTRARPRRRLSTDRVLRTAIQIADRDGIDALSMRRLAQKLGVEAMTLYHYVAKKDDILAGIVDLVVGEIELPSRGGDWRPAMRRSAISAHQVLLRHPWACALLTSATPGVRSARVRYMDAVLGRLRDAGLSTEMTHHAYHALDSHIVGFTLWEVGYSAVAKDLPALGASFLRALPVDEYPHLAEHVAYHLAGARRDDGEGEFEFGLDLILDGLERLRLTPPRLPSLL